MDEMFIGKAIMNRISIDVSTYRIHQFMRNYISALQHNNASSRNDKLDLNTSKINQILSSDGKKSQLIDQVISEAITYFTACVGTKSAKDYWRHSCCSL